MLLPPPGGIAIRHVCWLICWLVGLFVCLFINIGPIRLDWLTGGLRVGGAQPGDRRVGGDQHRSGVADSWWRFERYIF